MERGNIGVDNLENLCRFCLSTLYDGTKLDIFNAESYSTNIVQKILSCLSLIVSEDDNLPNYICFSCAEKLDSFQDFRDTCHKSESFLIKLVSMTNVSLTGATKAQNAPASRSRKRANTNNFPPAPQQVFVKEEIPDQRYDELLPNSEMPSSSLNRVQESTFVSQGAYQPPPGIEIRRISRKEPAFLQSDAGGPVVKTEVNTNEAYSEEAICDTGSAFQYTGTEDSAANESDMYGGDDGDEGGFSGQYSGDISAQSSNVKGEDDDEDIILLSDDSDNEGANVITSQVPSEPKTKRAKKASFGESSAGNRGSMPGTSQERYSGTTTVDVAFKVIQRACPVCSKIFVTAQELRRHSVIHTGEKPHACHTCGKSFRQKNNLKRHMRSHLPGRFSSAATLKKTVLSSATKVSIKKQMCSTCFKQFHTLRDLKRHIMIHTGEKPFACQLCGRRFNRKGSLKTHQLVHTPDKPFCCGVCSRTFSSEKVFQEHCIIHTLPQIM